jgi:sterol desaturase/sphingolipid hydroxylase (fatty acid hydroxylase superfamily)
MSASRQIARYGYAPFMLLGLNGTAYWVVANGHSYAWLAPLILVALGTAFLAEHVSPWYPEWNGHHDDEAATALHALVYEISNVNGVLLIPLIVWLFPWGTGIWPHDWPLVAQWLTAVVAVDFAFMFMHFLSHRYAILWRLHAVHHGLGRLQGFNGFVRHPIHQTLDMMVGIMPLVILGMPVQVAVLMGFSVSIQLIVQHSNVSYELGPFRNHLSIGQLHHLHHVNWGKEGDCNFGLFLTLWDRLFGTFQPEPPHKIEASDMGIDEVPNFPRQSFWQQMVFPFVYEPGKGDPIAKRQGAAVSEATAPAKREPPRLHAAE